MMSRKLEDWFYPEADRMLREIEPGLSWNVGIPVMVRKAWDYQQVEIDRLKSIINMLNEVVRDVKNDN